MKNRKKDCRIWNGGEHRRGIKNAAREKKKEVKNRGKEKDEEKAENNFTNYNKTCGKTKRELNGSRHNNKEEKLSKTNREGKARSKGTEMSMIQ